MAAVTAAQTATPATGERTSPYAWFVLFVLFMVYILNFLDRQLLAILTEPIRKELGLSDTQMGMLGGIYFAAFYTIIGIPVGWLADRTNRVRILALGCFLWSLCTFACGVAKTYPMLVAARMGVGVGEAGGAPPSYSIISDYFPAHKRGQALALFSLGVPMGQGLGAAFGGKTAELYGWRMAFIALGIIGVVMSILVLLLVREPKRGAQDVALDTHMTEAPPVGLEEEKAKFGQTIKEFFGRKLLLYAALACGSTAFILYAILQWALPVMMRETGVSLGEISLYYGLTIAVAMGVGTWLSGILVDKLRKWRSDAYALVPVGSLLLSAPFLLLFLHSPTWQTALMALSIPMFSTMAYLAPALAVVQNSVKPSQRTMSGALLLLVLNLIGLGGGPTFVGIVSDALHPAYGDHSLKMAMHWLLPVYAIAIFFLMMEARELRREAAAKK